MGQNLRFLAHRQRFGRFLGRFSIETMELGLRRVDAVAKRLILLRTTFYPKWSGQNARSGTENFDFAFALPKEMPPPPLWGRSEPSPLRARRINTLPRAWKTHARGAYKPRFRPATAAQVSAYVRFLTLERGQLNEILGRRYVCDFTEHAHAEKENNPSKC